MAVQLPSSLRSLRTKIVRSPCVDCAMPPTTCLRLRSYDFSKFFKLPAEPNRRGRGACESVRKSHSRLLPPHGCLAEAARKGGHRQETGSVDIAGQMWTRHDTWPWVYTRWLFCPCIAHRLIIATKPYRNISQKTRNVIAKTNIGKQSLSCSGPFNWNALQTDIRDN